MQFTCFKPPKTIFQHPQRLFSSRQKNTKEIQTADYQSFMKIRKTARFSPLLWLCWLLSQNRKGCLSTYNLVFNNSASRLSACLDRIAGWHPAISGLLSPASASSTVMLSRGSQEAAKPVHYNPSAYPFALPYILITSFSMAGGTMPAIG
ncbi:hypothetical protein SAMN04487825_10837 [Prevotella sp. kh1p2]|nr:hypothetical protein SAMN04487825_10837 [Prevotella sp. kh1p2]SNU11176.1 hypothetical protein SAMN06298210_10837 [Prevotellaceae bacterium KH2P17]